MKLNLKFSWALIVYLLSGILVVALLILFWLNYSWVQNIQKSSETTPPTTSVNVDNNLYQNVIDKIDAKQKISIPNIETVRDIMAPPASPNINNSIDVNNNINIPVNSNTSVK